MRLSKLLSDRGLASRREAERLVREGLVTVNGEVAEHPAHEVDPDRDHVKLRGRRVPGQVKKLYLAMNKPPATITANRDPQERQTVHDLLEGTRYEGKVEPVGRLDYGSEGLLLLTNDGDLAHRLTHPRFHVPKTYAVKITGNLDVRKLRLLRKGVPLNDGRSAPAVVTVTQERTRNAWLRVTVREGRNRLVRRMVEFVGHRVLRLKRLSFGGVELGDLPKGKTRVLSHEEIGLLRKMVEGEGTRVFDAALKRQEAGPRAPAPKGRRKGRGRKRSGPGSGRRPRSARRSR